MLPAFLNKPIFAALLNISSISAFILAVTKFFNPIVSFVILILALLIQWNKYQQSKADRKIDEVKLEKHKLRIGDE